MTIAATQGRPGSRKDERLNLRLPGEVKHIIEQAAALTGKSLTGFAAAALQREAERVVQEARIIHLSNDDFDRFVASLETDNEPNETFRHAAEKYSRNPI